MKKIRIVPDSLSERKIVSLSLMHSGGALKNTVAFVPSFFFEGENFTGGLDDGLGVGSFCLLIFNIGVQRLHLRGHVRPSLVPHANVDTVVDLVCSFSRGDGITKVLEEGYNLLTSGW